jgi:hypothetical protein
LPSARSVASQAAPATLLAAPVRVPATPTAALQQVVAMETAILMAVPRRVFAIGKTAKTVNSVTAGAALRVVTAARGVVQGVDSMAIATRGAAQQTVSATPGDVLKTCLLPARLFVPKTCGAWAQ